MNKQSPAAAAAHAAEHSRIDSTNARLKSFIERIERLEEEKKGIADDIRDVFAEAKGTGFDVKIMRQVIRLRRMEEADRREQEELLDVYLKALGMLADTPMGRAATEFRDNIQDLAGKGIKTSISVVRDGKPETILKSSDVAACAEHKGTAA